jgi:lipopolysaccharide export system permease protein
MIKNSVINTYLIKEFLLSILNTTLVFSAGGLIMNLREEVTYFADYDVGIMLPIALSFMIVPSILINIFPFIIFLSAMWTLIKLKNSGEILSLKTFGYSNANFVYLMGVSSFFVGIIILTAFNPITSLMVKYYEDIKGSYDLDKSHLASITNNGVWIKENIGTKTNFIKSKTIDGDLLIDVSIYSFDNNVFSQRIEAKTAKILDVPWIVKDGFIAKFNETTINKKFEIMTFESTFNKAKFNSIYSNLDTISFYKIMTNMKDLEERGYNNRLLSEKKHYYLSLPFFLVLMICLAAIFTLSTSEKKQNIYYIILSIITCVIIFYFKNFSMALGTTERIPLEISVWSPIIILTLFCSIGIMQINEK